jgi:thiamine pyrophosphokinase
MESKTISHQDLFQGAQSVALIANGAIHDHDVIASLIQSYDRCIAVDGGLIHCKEMHLVTDLIIGDFDSISQELLQFFLHVPTQTFPTEKDETDMELAVRAANAPSVKKIGIFGALEKRTDHALGNLHLMRRYPEKIVIETERELLRSISGHHRFDSYPGQVISLIPIGNSPQDVTTKGLKWELNHATLNQDFISLSNICLGSSFEISIGEGDLICCILR